MEMNEESNDNRNTIDLVQKFEKMISRNDSYYFDMDQLEEIVDYYSETGLFSQALKVIEYGYGLFPDNMTLMLRRVPPSFAASPSAISLATRLRGT